jgi:hypothetical protein
MQESVLWNTNGVGDGAADITRAQWIDFFRMLFLRDYTTQGVATGFLNALAVSSTGNNNVRVASGGAVVRGFLYQNTANVDHTVTSPVADTGFRVVLRADWDAQTVRQDVVMNTTGVTDPPALVQIELDTWEISLATGTITSGGVISVTSAPTSMYYNTKVNTVMVDDAAITAAKLAAAVAGDGLAGGAGSALSVNVDGVGIELNTDALRLKDLGVVTAKINDLAVTTGKLAASSVTGPKIGVGGLRIEKRRGDDANDWSSGTTSGDPGQTNYTLALPAKSYVICQALQIAAASADATSVVEFPETLTNPPACFVSLVRDDLNEGVFLEAEPTFGDETTQATVTANRRDPTSTASPLNLVFLLLVIGE